MIEALLLTALLINLGAALLVMHTIWRKLYRGRRDLLLGILLIVLNLGLAVWSLGRLVT